MIVRWRPLDAGSGTAHRDGAAQRGPQVTRGETLATAFPDWQNESERWLFVTPHDDDIVLGAGLLLRAALARAVPCTVVVVTDGRMGYCHSDQRGNIVSIRRAETETALGILGEPPVLRLGYPDCDLARHGGRRAVVTAEEPDRRGGHSGLQNSFTALLRAIRPTRVFVPTGADYHPDHQITHRELLISLFHATGVVWPELGQPLAAVPELYEMAVYCDFPDVPTIELEGEPADLEAKLRAIEAFSSQEQIEALVRTVREAGPFEYFRELPFSLYDPRDYSALFRGERE
jgi:LmbE family N-acetylglucosaminyl deacetylase